MGGHLFSGVQVVKFAKPPLTYREQIDLLVSRGMRIDNYGRARRFLSHLNYYRLIASCAHHSSLWNREFTIAWKLPTRRPGSLLVNLNRDCNNKLYNTLATLAYLMDFLNPGHHWKKRLGDLFRHHPAVKERYMGFPENCRELPLWRGNV